MRDVEIPKESYKTQEEAGKKYFIPRGGRCLGTKEYWVGTIDPVKEKELKEKKKEEK